MESRIKFFWARLNANYWLYPALFAVAAAALAFAMLILDRSGFAERVNQIGWFIPARPQGAANILSVMASTMIGVASTVFSITIVAVSFASGNYGPRLLTNFLSDKGNQISLATFIGSFVYVLIVLRSVRAESEVAGTGVGAVATTLPGFVPQLSLLVAYALMAACIGVLVFFLNHVPSSIRVNKVLQGIGEKLVAAVRELYPLEPELDEALPPPSGAEVKARKTGYVQLIDFDELVTLARANDCRFALRVRTGDFVHRELPLLEVAGAAPEGLRDEVCSHFTIGSVRTPEQDPQFLMDELVEIGLRALSPGINDPFTAVTALHWLGAATCEIAQRNLTRNVCDDGDRDCPVVPLPDDFAHYLRRGFGSLRNAVATSPSAAKVMLDVIANAAVPVTDANRRGMLREQGRLLIEQTREALVGPDLAEVEKRYRAVTKQLSN